MTRKSQRNNSTGSIWARFLKTKKCYDLRIVHLRAGSASAAIDAAGTRDSVDNESLESWAKTYVEMTKPNDVLQHKGKGKSNAPLDAIMSAIGAEEVKEHFLRIREFSNETEQPSQLRLFNLALYGDDRNSKRKVAYLYGLFLQSLGITSPKQKLKVIQEETNARSIQDLERIGSSTNTVLILILPEEGTYDFLDQGDDDPFNIPVLVSVPEYNHSTHDDLRQLVVREKDSKGISLDPVDEEVTINCLAHQASKPGPMSLFDNAENVVRVLDKAYERMKHRTLLEASQDQHQGRGKILKQRWERNNISKSQQQAESEDHTEAATATITIEDLQPLQHLKLEDVVGPAKPDLKSTNQSWKQLQSMIGLETVKEEFSQIIEYAQNRLDDERLGVVRPRDFSLHRAFLGPPGVGKTTVAKLYGQLILDLGLVSGRSHKAWMESTKRSLTNAPRSSQHKVPIVATPSLLIGPYIGHSEKMTDEYLSAAMGGVLIIDEMHALHTMRANGETSSDVFRTAVISTIVEKVTTDANEDRCVILVGYPDAMENMFLHSNTGLQRRFPRETAINIDAYNIDQLLRIFSAKMDAKSLQATDDAKEVAKQMLVRMKISPNFGNAGDVEKLLEIARTLKLSKSHKTPLAWSLGQPLKLEPQDIDPDWERLMNAGSSRTKLFENFIGFQHITDKFKQEETMIRGIKNHKIDPRDWVNWNFIFEGPPGTGKTSTARMLASLYYTMELLSSHEVVECSVGELLDITGLKLVNILDKSLGKVLFIDEAYRLAKSMTGLAVVSELVDAMTKKRYERNLVIVLAGYRSEMNDLLEANPGLRSRFPERIRFPSLKPDACLSLLVQELANQHITLTDKPGDIKSRKKAIKGFRIISNTPG